MSSVMRHGSTGCFTSRTGPPKTFSAPESFNHHQSETHRAPRPEVGGLMVHPAARGFGLASVAEKVMMVYAVKESGRDSPDEQYLAHVADGNGAPIHALLEAGFRPAGHVDVHRGEVDAVMDHMLMGGRPGFGCRPSCSIVKRWETWFRPFGNSCARTAACSPDPTEQVILGRRLISRT